MDNLVSINHTKENILKFNLSIEGINPSDIVAKFVIHGQSMELGFLCGRQTGDEWIVIIPALPVLERTAYPFHFDIVADGYHFEPLRGTVNVVGGHDVYISAPKNPKISPEAGPKEEKKEPKKESIVVPSPADLPRKGKERSIAQIAKELMEIAAKKVVTAPIVQKQEPVVEVKKEEPIVEPMVETKPEVIEEPVVDEVIAEPVQLVEEPKIEPVVQPVVKSETIIAEIKPDITIESIAETIAKMESSIEKKSEVKVQPTEPIVIIETKPEVTITIQSIAETLAKMESSIEKTEVKEEVPILETKTEKKEVLAVTTTLLPTIKIDIKKGDKDEDVRAILEQSGIDPKILKKRRFSLKKKN